jgi:hypothetical protein
MEKIQEETLRGKVGPRVRRVYPHRIAAAAFFASAGVVESDGRSDPGA